MKLFRTTLLFILFLACGQMTVVAGDVNAPLNNSTSSSVDNQMVAVVKEGARFSASDLALFSLVPLTLIMVIVVLLRFYYRSKIKDLELSISSLKEFIENDRHNFLDYQEKVHDAEGRYLKVLEKVEKESNLNREALKMAAETTAEATELAEKYSPNAAPIDGNEMLFINLMLRDENEGFTELTVTLKTALCAVMVYKGKNQAAMCKSARIEQKNFRTFTKQLEKLYDLFNVPKGGDRCLELYYDLADIREHLNSNPEIRKQLKKARKELYYSESEEPINLNNTPE